MKLLDCLKTIQRKMLQKTFLTSYVLFKKMKQNIETLVSDFAKFSIKRNPKKARQNRITKRKQKRLKQNIKYIFDINDSRCFTCNEKMSIYDVYVIDDNKTKQLKAIIWCKCCDEIH